MTCRALGPAQKSITSGPSGRKPLPVLVGAAAVEECQRQGDQHGSMKTAMGPPDIETTVGTVDLSTSGEQCSSIARARYAADTITAS